jgi:hypothetical protein
VAHPNEELLRKGYDAFSKGDMGTLRDLFDPNIKWHIPGRSPIAGDYNGVDEVFGFFAQIAERSGGSFNIEIHDVLVNDTHGVVLVAARGERNGKRLNDRNVHVWHIQNGKTTEFWGHSSDQYAVDEFWS